MKVTAAIVSVGFVAWCFSSLRTHQGVYTAKSFRQRYGDWAIVAGASEGLGAAWADSLCEHGINVLLVARRENALNEVARDLLSTPKVRCQVDTLVQDLSSQDIDEVFKGVLSDATRRYGLLVYNAAKSGHGNFVDLNLQSELKTIDVNVRGVLSLTHVFSNYLSSLKGDRRGGGIILMSSLSGMVGVGTIATYSASKSLITAFAQAIAWEFREIHRNGGVPVDVLACKAGATSTPSYNKFADDVSGELISTVQRPEEVVDECMHALGMTRNDVSSVATGPINKLGRLFLSRILPAGIAVNFMTEETIQRRRKEP